MPEPDLIELFVARLGEIGAHYLVTGSVAATLYGEPRATHDIDLVVELSGEHRDALPKVFSAKEFYVPPPEVVLVDMATSPCDGPSFVGRIRSNTGLARLKLYALSSTDPALLGVATGPNGIDHWFPKPVDPEHLVSVVTQELGTTTTV